ncbi:MAG: hypothetical protein EZS28_030374, partial [Streblomastix strix]
MSINVRSYTILFPPSIQIKYYVTTTLALKIIRRILSYPPTVNIQRCVFQNIHLTIGTSIPKPNTGVASIFAELGNYTSNTQITQLTISEVLFENVKLEQSDSTGDIEKESGSTNVRHIAPLVVRLGDSDDLINQDSVTMTRLRFLGCSGCRTGGNNYLLEDSDDPGSDFYFGSLVERTTLVSERFQQCYTSDYSPRIGKKIPDSDVESDIKRGENDYMMKKFRPTIYVDLGGDDRSGKGTNQSPLRTLSASIYLTRPNHGFRYEGGHEMSQGAIRVLQNNQQQQQIREMRLINMNPGTYEEGSIGIYTQTLTIQGSSNTSQTIIKSKSILLGGVSKQTNALFILRDNQDCILILQNLQFTQTLTSNDYTANEDALISLMYGEVTLRDCQFIQSITSASPNYPSQLLVLAANKANCTNIKFNQGTFHNIPAITVKEQCRTFLYNCSFTGIQLDQQSNDIPSALLIEMNEIDVVIKGCTFNNCQNGTSPITVVSKCANEYEPSIAFDQCSFIGGTGQQAGAVLLKSSTFTSSQPDQILLFSFAGCSFSNNQYLGSDSNLGNYITIKCKTIDDLFVRAAFGGCTNNTQSIKVNGIMNDGSQQPSGLDNLIFDTNEKTFFVATGGSDSNQGNINTNPLLTIKEALSRTNAGGSSYNGDQVGKKTIIQVGPSIYTENGLNIGARAINITGELTSQLQNDISGSNKQYLFRIIGGQLSLQTFILKMIETSSPEVDYNGFIIQSGSGQLQMTDCNISQINDNQIQNNNIIIIRGGSADLYKINFAIANFSKGSCNVKYERNADNLVMLECRMMNINTTTSEEEEWINNATTQRVAIDRNIIGYAGGAIKIISADNVQLRSMTFNNCQGLIVGALLIKQIRGILSISNTSFQLNIARALDNIQQLEYSEDRWLYANDILFDHEYQSSYIRGGNITSISSTSQFPKTGSMNHPEYSYGVFDSLLQTPGQSLTSLFSVSVDGDDSGSGDQSNPLKTVERAISRAVNTANVSSSIQIGEGIFEERYLRIGGRSVSLLGSLSSDSDELITSTNIGVAEESLL